MTGWLSQLRPDFGSVHDPRFLESSPTWGSLLKEESLLFPLPPLPLLVRSFSLSPSLSDK